MRSCAIQERCSQILTLSHFGNAVCMNAFSCLLEVKCGHMTCFGKWNKKEGHVWLVYDSVKSFCVFYHYLLLPFPLQCSRWCLLPSLWFRQSNTKLPKPPHDRHVLRLRNKHLWFNPLKHRGWMLYYMFISPGQVSYHHVSPIYPPPPPQPSSPPQSPHIFPYPLLFSFFSFLLNS